MGNISVVIASCLNKPEREGYLKKSIESIYKNMKNFEIIVCFDKYGKDIDGVKCYTHDKGMGHSWNSGIRNAENNLILQIEDDWVLEVGGRNEKNIPNRESFFYHLENRINIVEKSDGLFKFTNIDDEFWPPGKIKHDFDGYKCKELRRPLTFNPLSWDMYIYSNQPHLKKKSFHEDVGYYVENCPPSIVEIDMCKKVFNSNKNIFLSDFFTFVHIGVARSR